MILTFGYLAIFLLMVANGIVSLPPSQFIYVPVGIFVASGHLEFLPAVMIGAIGNDFGNVILYEASRRKGMKYIPRWQMFSEEKIRKLHIAFQRRGSVIIFIGKFLPGVKVIVPVVAGIASMHRLAYIVIIFVTSLLWAIGLTSFGFYFGRNIGDGKAGTYSSVALVVLACVAIYVFLRYIRKISLEETESTEAIT